MKDIQINPEIRSYSEKVVLNMFNLREAICVGVCLIIGIASWILIPDELAIIRYVVIILGITIPVIIGFYNYNGLKGEQFLKALWNYYFIQPKRYTCLPKHEYYPLLEDEIKKNIFKDIKRS